MKRSGRALITIFLLFCCMPSYASDPAITVYYEENAQVELISSQGSRILIDVYDPTQLSKPATDDDILLVTHSHPDHTNAFFLCIYSGGLKAIC